jgi:hypothetical protein
MHVKKSMLHHVVATSCTDRVTEHKKSIGIAALLCA